MKGMKTLEINPRHPLIVELKRQVIFGCPVKLLLWNFQACNCDGSSEIWHILHSA